jgi:hypothetical protein
MAKRHRKSRNFGSGSPLNYKGKAMAKKNTGLSDFADTQEEATQEKPHVRTKGTGKVIHAQLRFTSQDQWQRATLFAMSEGVSLNQLALMGMSRLMKEKGLPGLLDT